MTAAPDMPAGFELRSYDVLASTNDEAKRLAAEGAPEGTLVQATSQSMGHGRQGRRWESPAGNLYCSLILRPACSPGEAAHYAFIAALAIRDAIAPFLNADHELRLKWPNDLLVDGAKISGILLESVLRPGGGVEWLVIGLGVNIVSHPDIPDIRTTSVHAAGGAGISPRHVLAAFCAAFAVWRARQSQFGFAPVRRAWLAAAQDAGQPVRIRHGGEDMDGIFVDLDESGALVLELENGMRKRIMAGDVFPAQSQMAHS